MKIQQSIANELMDTMAKTICCAYANIDDEATLECLQGEKGTKFINALTREMFEDFCDNIGIDTVVEGE